MTDQRSKRTVALVLDAAERVSLAALFAYFSYNMLSSFIETGKPYSLILLISEAAVLVFVLLRRPTTNITLRPFDWGLAYVGTLLPLMAMSGGGGALISPVIVLVMMIAGAVLEITAKLFLRRSFGIVAANRGVQVGGPYRIVRHPMYAGYALTQLGFLLANPTAWNLAIYAFGWSMQLGRILAEERLLLNDEAYRRFAAEVPYRLIPGVF